MQKILLAIDPVNINMVALDFACYLGRVTRSGITGVFLENFAAEQKPVVKNMHGMAYMDWEVDEKSETHKTKMQRIEKNISLFREACTRREVNCSVHEDRGVPVNDLLEETRFADMLIVNSDMTFKEDYEGSLSEFVETVLKKAGCPVIIAPQSFYGIDEIVIACNASDSSVYAMKLFTYLFPQFQNKKVVVLRAGKKGKHTGPANSRLCEWLQYHYKDIHYEEGSGRADYVLFDYALKRKNALLVMGAFGRNALSEFFKRSSAELLIKTIPQPVFIAHS